MASKRGSVPSGNTPGKPPSKGRNRDGSGTQGEPYSSQRGSHLYLLQPRGQPSGSISHFYLQYLLFVVPHNIMLNCLK